MRAALVICSAALVSLSCSGNNASPDAGTTPDGGAPDGGSSPPDAGPCQPTNDHCPALQYCNAGQCVPGCKAGSECFSGVCQTNHDCAQCIGNNECVQGEQCSQPGLCAPSCGTCAGALSCCGVACSDTSRDINNCGGCSTACAGTQFCDGTACDVVVLSNACKNPKVTVLLDGLADDDAGIQIADAVDDGGCALAPPITFAPQASAGAVMDVTSGRPIAGGGELLIASGGPFGQKVVGYLEQAATPVYFASTNGGNTSQFLRRDGGVILSVNNSALDATHDDFLVELVREPYNGSLTLVSYGLYSPGTYAGARYLAHVLLPNLSAASQPWQVIHWDGSDGGDTFTLVGAGP